MSTEVKDLPLEDRVQEVAVAPIQQPESDTDQVEDIGEDGDDTNGSGVWGGSFAPRRARPSGFTT